jgi:hypothetical protein
MEIDDFQFIGVAEQQHFRNNFADANQKHIPIQYVVVSEIQKQML